MPEKDPSSGTDCVRATLPQGEMEELRRKLICPSCQRAAGIFACSVGQITGTYPRIPRPNEGRFAIVTNVGRGERWTRVVQQTNARPERTAKSCGSDFSTLKSSWPRKLRITG